MPCRDDGYPNENVPSWMLCEAMVIIDNMNLLNECSAGLHSWWRKHAKEEETRVRREALAKLTPRERVALGLNSDGSSPLRNAK